MPKRLLRSIIDHNNPEITPEHLSRNYQTLLRAVDNKQFEWERPSDDKVFKYVRSYFNQFGEVPAATSVVDYFTDLKAAEEIERVKDLAAETPYVRTSFLNLLRGLQENQATHKASQFLKETHEILVKGREDKDTKEIKKGVEAAHTYLMDNFSNLIIHDYPVEIHRDIRQDDEVMKEEYLKAEMDQGRVIGALSGIREMDEICKGAKKGELWVHAAFPGHLKTGLALNWAYNLCTRFRRNVVYISFEMPMIQIRRKLFALHSTNARFAVEGFKPLNYTHIRDGILTPEERYHYLNNVVQDFKRNKSYATIEVVTPDRPWNLDDIRTQLLSLHREMDIDMVIFDHGMWIEPRKHYKDYVIGLNSVVNESKQLALQFNHNEGLAVLMLYQINRQGKAMADKNEGVYDMSAITYSNAIDKSADVITTTYLNNDYRKQGLTKFCCLKNRDNPLFEPFECHINFPSMKMMSRSATDIPGFSVDDVESQLSGIEIPSI